MCNDKDRSVYICTRGCVYARMYLYVCTCVCVCVYVLYTGMRRSSSVFAYTRTDGLKSSAESFQINPSIDTFRKIFFFHIVQAREKLGFALF